MTRTYSVGGKGHRMLARLEEGPATARELKDVAVPDGGKRWRRAHRLLDALREDQLAWSRYGLFHLTDSGRDALACLRLGHPVTLGAQPTVRFFTREAA